MEKQYYGKRRHLRHVRGGEVEIEADFTLVDRRIDERLWFGHYIMIDSLTG